MHEQVKLTIREGTENRTIKGVRAGKDETGHHPHYAHQTVIKHLHSGGYIVRRPHGGSMVIPESDVCNSLDTLKSH